jgi:small subunit ribosomal protein S2
LSERDRPILPIEAHYAYPKARRHPSSRPYIFGSKGNVELFDLEKTIPALEKATSFIEAVAATGKQVVFAASKLEARQAVSMTAEALGLPYVAGRWVGGTFSNFAIIKKRIEHLEKLTEDREKGTLVKYTKLERLPSTARLSVSKRPSADSAVCVRSLQR